jgi:hypothetical protein
MGTRPQASLTSSHALRRRYGPGARWGHPCGSHRPDLPSQGGTKRVASTNKIRDAKLTSTTLPLPLHLRLLMLTPLQVLRDSEREEEETKGRPAAARQPPPPPPRQSVETSIGEDKSVEAGSLQGRALLPAPPPGSVAGGTKEELPRQRAAAEAETARRRIGVSRTADNAPVAAHGRERVRARRPRPLPHGRPARPGGHPRWRRHGRPRRSPPPARRPRGVRAPHPFTSSPCSP